MKKILLVLLLATLIVGCSANNVKQEKIIESPQMNALPTSNISSYDVLSTIGYTLVNITADENAVYYTSNCTQIGMAPFQVQIDSIMQGLEKKLASRPMTHDLIKDMLDGFNIKVLMVKITDLDEGTYFAHLYLKQDNKLLDLDSRPSDAAAIATRYNVPVYIKTEIMNKSGVDICKKG